MSHSWRFYPVNTDLTPLARVAGHSNHVPRVGGVHTELLRVDGAIVPVPTGDQPPLLRHCGLSLLKVVALPLPGAGGQPRMVRLELYITVTLRLATSHITRHSLGRDKFSGIKLP